MEKIKFKRALKARKKKQKQLHKVVKGIIRDSKDIERSLWLLMRVQKTLSDGLLVMALYNRELTKMHEHENF